jgi:hypothetical protein
VGRREERPKEMSLLRRSLTIAGASIVSVTAACTVDIGEEPFACAAQATCPDGYECQSGVCVLDGATPSQRRVMRITWINSGEMYWFPSVTGSGATLVVNDGFTPGARGLYEIRVDEDGRVSDPTLIVDLGEDAPTASSVIALDDETYGVLTMAFPGVEESTQLLSFRRVAREGSGAATTLLYDEQVTFVGGVEPPYVAARPSAEGIDLCFSDASQGGRFKLLRIDGKTLVRSLLLPLPPSVLPLSGDCQLWPGDGELFVRIGLDAPEVYRVPDAAASEEDVTLLSPPTSGFPVHANAERILSVRADGDVAVLVSTSWEGGTTESEIGSYSETWEPHTVVEADGELLLGPIGVDPSFSELRVDRIDGDTATEVTTLPRLGSDEVYSGRSFRRGDKVYFAWTALREDLMDLWVSVKAP